MKKIRKIYPFYIHGLKQKPKDTDFHLTPSLVFAHYNCGDLGNAYAIGLKIGYIAFGFKLYIITKTKRNNNSEG